MDTSHNKTMSKPAAIEHSAHNIASEEQKVLVIRGKHKGRVVRVSNVGIEKITFWENLRPRFVRHKDYESILEPSAPTMATHTNVPMAAVVDASPTNSSYETANGNDGIRDTYTKGLIIALANHVAARSSTATDIDSMVDDINLQLRHMTLGLVESRQSGR